MTEPTKKFDFLFKILFIGDSGAGKTSILNRYADEYFTGTFISTIGIDFKIKTIELDGKIIKLQLWDTAGQERFRSITQSYYRGAAGVILVYDITNSKSFENVKTWISAIRDYDVVLIIVGNKCDLEAGRVITRTQGEAVAKEYNAIFFETSAKLNIEIGNVISRLAKEIKDKVTCKVTDKVTDKITDKVTGNIVADATFGKEKVTKKSKCVIL